MTRPSRPARSVPASVAGLLLGLSCFLAFFLAPAAVAQVGGLDVTGGGDGGDDRAAAPPPPGAPDGGLGDPGFALDGMFEGLGFPGGVMIGVAVTLGVIFATLAFLGGTKYVNSENVLENEARRTIFEYIRENPGAHLRATATALDLSTTNVLWHLRKLEGANLVASKKFEGYKVFYPVEGGIESRRRALALAVLRNDNARDILDFILGQPSAHQREIARVLGVNHGTIRWHLRKLTDAGLVLQVKKDATSNYYVSELGLQILGEMGNAKARAHAAGAALAPGAAMPASIALPVQTARPAAAPPPAYGPSDEE